MYHKNEILKKIMKEYNLREGSKVDIDLLFKICKLEKIEMNDLKCILQISSKTIYRLKKGIQKYTILRFNKYNGITDKELLKNGKIDYVGFINLQKQLKVKTYTLLRNLGISIYSYNKLKSGEIVEVIIEDVEVRHIVRLIMIDLKYTDKYQDGYCPISDLKKRCRRNRISIKQFTRYCGNNPRHQKFNEMIIKKSEKGFYIKGKCRMTNEFLENNYEKIMKGLTRVATKVSIKIGCKSFNEDLIQDAINKLYQECGDIVKKFYFDMKVLFNILMSKAKYMMLNVYKNEYKELNHVHYNGFEDGYIDHTNIFRDDRYNPELLF